MALLLHQPLQLFARLCAIEGVGKGPLSEGIVVFYFLKDHFVIITFFQVTFGAAISLGKYGNENQTLELGRDGFKTQLPSNLPYCLSGGS